MTHQPTNPLSAQCQGPICDADSNLRAFLNEVFCRRQRSEIEKRKNDNHNTDHNKHNPNHNLSFNHDKKQPRSPLSLRSPQLRLRERWPLLRRTTATFLSFCAKGFRVKGFPNSWEREREIASDQSTAPGTPEQQQQAPAEEPPAAHNHTQREPRSRQQPSTYDTHWQVGHQSFLLRRPWWHTWLPQTWPPALPVGPLLANLAHAEAAGFWLIGSVRHMVPSNPPPHPPS